MSAVPVPVLVVGGTSDLPSSLIVILSAKAGPAKANAAPSASVASMILVFDMVLSLWAPTGGASFKTARLRSYSRTWPYWREIFKHRMARTAGILAVRWNDKWTGECCDEFSLPSLLPRPLALQFSGG